MAYLHFMMFSRLTTGLCILILFSCKASKHVTGIYHAGKDAGAQLVLKTDSTFEWIYPGSKAIEIGTSSTPRNQLYYSGGKWTFDRGQLLLIASANEDAKNTYANDSISRFTSISSFNFWNRFGEQVKIRAIKLPRSLPKPHFGNTLYFFSQDFHKTDTLVFYLDGYRPFVYPGTIPSAIGDNIHKITLFEPYHETDQKIIKIRGKKLYADKEYYVRKK
jgi:hypothetical protein